jgi:hypothetical protein
MWLCGCERDKISFKILKDVLSPLGEKSKSIFYCIMLYFYSQVRIRYMYYKIKTTKYSTYMLYSKLVYYMYVHLLFLAMPIINFNCSCATMIKQVSKSPSI